MNTEFNGAELRLARIFNRQTLEDVAEKVGKTRQYLHKLETGQAVPTEQLLSELASVLRVEPSFFTKEKPSIITEDQFHFRGHLTARVSVKQEVIARGELIKRLVEILERELRLPKINIPQVEHISTSEEIERAAELCRNVWGLGLGPITDMTRLAENIGAVVTNFHSLSKEIDALSVVIKRPIIVCNEAKESICRQRFDIGHELGHLVLHAGIITGDRITEGQANRFSGALIIPRTMMAKLFPRPRGSRLDWVGLREFKLTWKMSKAGILYRARQLDLIDDSQYKTGVITLSRTGEATGEKDDYLIPPEKPELLSRSFNVLAEKKGIYAKDIAAMLGISPSLLDDMVGGGSIIPTPSLEAPKQRPALYLVA